MSKSRVLSKLLVPDPAIANTYLRRNSINSVYEARTPIQLVDEITPLRDWRGRNVLINGNFDRWQRGTSFPYTGFGIYTSDRWRSFGGSGSAGTVSRQSFTLGQTDVPGEPEFFFRDNRTTASTVTNASVAQRVESVRSMAGQTVTWSFWAKVGSGTKDFSPGIQQNFGTGGSPSAAVFVLASAITITTTWQKFSTTFNIPSISGKTIGTNGNDFLSFEVFEEAPFSTFALDFAQSQAEKGSQAIEFEYRPPQTELALCQRYYENTYNINDAPGSTVGGGLFARTYVTASVQHSLTWQFKTKKRAIPTITLYGPTTGTSGVMFVDGADRTAITALTNQHQSTGLLSAGHSASIANHEVRAHFTADAEL